MLETSSCSSRGKNSKVKMYGRVLGKFFGPVLETDMLSVSLYNESTKEFRDIFMYILCSLRQILAV